MENNDDAFALASAEVVRLHAALEAWFRGTIGNDRFDVELGNVLHPGFENIQPAGTVFTKAEICAALRAAHGTNPDFRITIEEPRLLGAWPELILMGYVEHQTGARHSAPENRRRSTVLFERNPSLSWRYLHETGLD